MQVDEDSGTVSGCVVGGNIAVPVMLTTGSDCNEAGMASGMPYMASIQSEQPSIAHSLPIQVAVITVQSMRHSPSIPKRCNVSTSLLSMI